MKSDLYLNIKIMYGVSIYHKMLENAINVSLDKRPRYFRWIPKKYYVKHFLEIHQQSDNKLDTFSISISYKIYDKLRKKYV